MNSPLGELGGISITLTLSHPLKLKLKYSIDNIQQTIKEPSLLCPISLDIDTVVMSANNTLPLCITLLLILIIIDLFFHLLHLCYHIRVLIDQWVFSREGLCGGNVASIISFQMQCGDLTFFRQGVIPGKILLLTFCNLIE